MEIGIISDTHGAITPQALAALQGVDHILHAGDVGGPPILAALEAIAPVTAVRGNTDVGPWALDLPMTEAVDLGGAIIYMLHDLADLDLDPQEAGFAVVLTGHTHRPQHEEKNGVLYLNPGSASQPRGGLPPSVARMVITDGAPHVEIVTLT